MAISTAIQKGTSVYVYNEKKQTSATISLSGGTLAGFSANFVCIQRNTSAYVYNEKGHQIGCITLSGGTVHSCTGTINIKRGTTIYMYNENGRQVGTTYAR